MRRLFLFIVGIVIASDGDLLIGLMVCFCAWTLRSR